MSSRSVRKIVLAYLVCVASVGVVVAVRAVLDPVMDRVAPLILFLLPVAVSAWFGGFAPGLFATALGMVLGILLFGRGAGPPHPVHGPAFVWFAAGLPFFIVGSLISLLASRLEAARMDARAQQLDARKKEEFIRRVMASSPDCIKVLDLNGQVVIINENAASLLEVDDITPLLNTCWADWWKEERSKAEAAVAEARAGRTGKFVAFCKTARGTPKWWDVMVAPILGPDGTPQQILAVSRDITERRRAESDRRRAEELQRRIFQSVTDFSIFTLGLDGRVTSWSPGAERLFGYTEAEAIGLEAAVLFTPEDRADQAPERELATARTTGSASDDRWHVRKDGSRFFVSGVVTPLREENERIVGFVKVARDVTPRQVAEQARERLLAEEKRLRATAEQVSRMKDDFLATISHELRTPLSAIVGWAGLLKSAARDAETLDEGIEVISRNAQAQSQLIEDILDMSRITSGKLRLNVVQTDLRQPIEAAIATVANGARAKDIRIVAELGDRPVEATADPDRIQQVFWNLLANAIKFTDRGGTIRVTLRAAVSRIIVEVSDTGRGMELDFLPFVFEQFRQADMSSTRRQGGLGLGLAIVRNLVELHGGTISVASDGPGRGSSFRVELPFATLQGDAAPSDDPADKAARAAEADWARRLAGARVLVLDDEPDARRVLQAVLAHNGVEVTIVASAADAVGVLSADSGFDAVLSDIGMPGEDGYAFLRRLRDLERSRAARPIPVAALTAYTRPIDRDRTLAAGFDAYLAKPVRTGELLQTLAGMLERSRRTD